MKHYVARINTIKFDRSLKIYIIIIRLVLKHFTYFADIYYETSYQIFV